MLYRGGEAYAIDLDIDSSVTDFKLDLADTFRYSVDNMLIKYFIPRNLKTLIMISKDKDLRRMINLFKDSDQVDVFVMPQVGGRGALIVLNMLAIRFLNNRLLDFNLALDFGFLTKARKYLKGNPEYQCCQILKYFKNRCQDENRHGDFFSALMKAQPQFLND
ncbi:FAR1-related sequence like protein [Tanacetum coccineum]